MIFENFRFHTFSEGKSQKMLKMPSEFVFCLSLGYKISVCLKLYVGMSDTAILSDAALLAEMCTQFSLLLEP